MLTLTQNEAIYEKACEVIPGGVNSPARAWRGLAEAPLVAKRGRGACLVDENGREYVDYCQSWGALILGHAQPQILAAAKAAMDDGSSFGMTTGVETHMAQKVCELLPTVEKVRFVSSGTEATMSAARLARGATGRPIIVKFTGHYHGHADFFLVQAGSGVAGLTATSSSAGIPEEVVRHTACLPFNDLEACERFFKEKGEQIAAVILEPVAANMGVVPPEPGFLEGLRRLTKGSGALLIFDEVITGFRVSLQGAAGLFGVEPDLSCFGKIVGGGFPAAAFGGKAEIMDHLAPIGTVYQAGTLSGNPVAMAAGLAALEQVSQPGFYEELDRRTQLITEPVQAFLEESGYPACIQRVGSLFTLFFGRRKVTCFEDSQDFDADAFRRYFHFMMARGILVSPSQYEACFVSAAHSEEHLLATREAILEFLQQSPPRTMV